MDSHTEQLQAAISKQIRIELAERRMSQQAAGEALGVTPATINRYLQGHRSIPMPVFCGAAELFGLRPSDLMARAEKRALPSRAAVQPAG